MTAAKELNRTKEVYSRYDRIQIVDVKSGRFIFSTDNSDLGCDVSNEAFFQRSTGRILFAKEFNNDLSSTKVRNRFAEGKDLHDSLDDAVYSYIKQHNLYH